MQTFEGYAFYLKDIVRCSIFACVVFLAYDLINAMVGHSNFYVRQETIWMVIGVFLSVSFVMLCGNAIHIFGLIKHTGEVRIVLDPRDAHVHVNQKFFRAGVPQDTEKMGDAKKHQNEQNVILICKQEK